MSRPPRNKEASDLKIGFRVTEEERAKIFRSAYAKGETVADFCRRLALNA